MTTTPARPICPRPLRLGLTGGIGSGKSTFAAMLRDCGAALIDADAIARAVTEAGGPAIADIRDTFGADYIDAQGALDRVRMRALVFADAGAKERLEAIVHPLVGNAIAQAAAVAAQAGQRLIVFDIPLLTESPRWARQLDAVLVVDCREESQVARVLPYQAQLAFERHDYAQARALMRELHQWGALPRLRPVIDYWNHS